MRDLHKKPDFYIIAVLAMAAIWTVTAAALSLPTANDKFDRKARDWEKSQPVVEKILKLDPDRLKAKNTKGGSGEFDYAITINEFTKFHAIPETGYSIRAGKIMKRGGSKTKSADMTISSIGIVQFTQFISDLTYRWPDLQLDLLKLTKLKEGPDTWKLDLKFTYTY